MAKKQRLIISINCGGSSTKVIAGIKLSATTRTTLVMGFFAGTLEKGD